jgi:hypothetical protein
LFNIQDAYYQSWVAHNNEKGTDIMIQLINVQNEIRFDSLVFRGIQIPVYSWEKDGIVTLKGILSTDADKLHIPKKIVKKPDQLIYHFQGKKYFLLLENIHRLNTKYL